MDQDKATKKAAKAEAKAIKKRVKAEQAAATASREDPSPAAPGSAAERAANAAEKQLSIRRWQLWVSIVGVTAALITAAVTWMG